MPALSIINNTGEYTSSEQVEPRQPIRREAPWYAHGYGNGTCIRIPQILDFLWKMLILVQSIHRIQRSGQLSFEEELNLSSELQIVATKSTRLMQALSPVLTPHSSLTLFQISIRKTQDVLENIPSRRPFTLTDKVEEDLCDLVDHCGQVAQSLGIVRG